MAARLALRGHRSNITLLAQPGVPSWRFGVICLSCGVGSMRLWGGWVRAGEEKVSQVRWRSQQLGDTEQGAGLPWMHQMESKPAP